MSSAKSFEEYCKELGGDCSAALQQLLIDRGFADFDMLKREYVVEGVLVNDSLLSIGSGGEEPYSTIDNPVVRLSYANGEVVPVIPGSSLKGVLRSIVERIAASYGMLCVSPPAKLLEKCKGSVSAGMLRCTGEGLSEVERLIRTCCDGLIEFVREGGEEFVEKCLLSPVVGLFGAPWLSSHLVFYDAVPLDPEKAAVEVIRRVAIDRFTLSQRPGLLYSLEAVRPGVYWRFRLRIINIDLEHREDPRTKLFWDMIEALKRGVAAGRRTSVGHGVLRLEKVTSCTEYVIENGVLKTKDCMNLFK